MTGNEKSQERSCAYFIYYSADRLYLADQPDRLAGHQGTSLHVSVFNGLSQCPCPEFFDLELRFLLIDYLVVELVHQFQLQLGKFDGTVIFQRPDGDNRQPAVKAVLATSS